MENNSLLLGRIPNAGSGLRKTYIESTFISMSQSCFKSLFTYNINDRKILYLLIEENAIYFGNKNDDNGNPRTDIKEFEVLSVYPFESDFIAEIIDKQVLYNHLQDERIQLEELKNSGIKLELGGQNGK